VNGHDFNHYDVVSLTSDRADLRAGTQVQVLGCYRRLRETSWVVAFDDRIIEDLHEDELAFVRSEHTRTPTTGRSAPKRVVLPRLR
jgi:hypothetical protein